MITWKHPLDGYEWLIHQVWYLEVENSDTIEQLPQLIPNPRAHLLFTPPEQAYCYQSGSDQLSGKGSHLLTACDRLLTLRDTAPLKRIGITFRPEGLYLLNKSNEALVNQCGWFDWLTPLFGKHFQQQLWQCDSKQSLIGNIQQHVGSLCFSSQIDKPFTTAQKAIALMEDSHCETPDQYIDVNQLANLCACSRRTLERSFRQVTGLSIKKYQLMIKLELMILALYKQEGDIDWTAFSQQFGFSDQSHLIRQLKQQLKRTPSSYLQNRDLTIDVYGDFE
ncbi:helix-turn-helix domain-containing protein [Photobacterium rosenbergii]|uniref:helix-turn-helix domain-containing protein n=1 Tax=Photobacterium rosenbergii TaxID=294936 RepID=UPI001C98F01D|nr:AraC family transcriptional regulator [Photobacterium rosenbergii]MBY5943919.1 AraC family transcriptional regulator [Photobacterium rosenbergii]